VLQHEFGVPPSSITGSRDGAEHVAGWSPPPWLRIERAPAGRKMQSLLETGELDAQILSDSGADASSYQQAVRRLWPNYREVEARLLSPPPEFSPIRHVVVVKDEVLQRDPEVAAHLVRVFEDAKQRAYHYWATTAGRIWPGSALNRKRSGRLARSRSLAVLGCRRIKSL